MKWTPEVWRYIWTVGNGLRALRCSLIQKDPSTNPDFLNDVRSRPLDFSWAALKNVYLKGKIKSFVCVCVCVFAVYAFGRHSFWNIFHSFSILSDDSSKASSKTIPPHSAI
jgi:hypothetical protein